MVNKRYWKILFYKENKFKKISEGYCPCCGSSNITYDTVNIGDDVACYPAQCNDCGVSYVYNREGERLGVVINLNGEEECPID